MPTASSAQFRHISRILLSIHTLHKARVHDRMSTVYDAETECGEVKSTLVVTRSDCATQSSAVPSKNADLVCLVARSTPLLGLGELGSPKGG